VEAAIESAMKYREVLNFQMLMTFSIHVAFELRPRLLPLLPADTINHFRAVIGYVSHFAPFATSPQDTVPVWSILSIQVKTLSCLWNSGLTYKVNFDKFKYPF
jgi:hypothetical protein